MQKEIHEETLLRKKVAAKPTTRSAADSERSMVGLEMEKSLLMKRNE